MNETTLVTAMMIRVIGTGSSRNGMQNSASWRQRAALSTTNRLDGQCRAQ
jgi:hypothetical protein